MPLARSAASAKRVFARLFAAKTTRTIPTSQAPASRLLRTCSQSRITGRGTSPAENEERVGVIDAHPLLCLSALARTPLSPREPRSLESPPACPYRRLGSA